MIKLPAIKVQSKNIKRKRALHTYTSIYMTFLVKLEEAAQIFGVKKILKGETNKMRPPFHLQEITKAAALKTSLLGHFVPLKRASNLTMIP